jgi:hypothetical protein
MAIGFGKRHLSKVISHPVYRSHSSFGASDRAVSPCTNFTEMWVNFNYTDPENPSSGGGSVELTNAESYMQIGAFPTPGYGAADLPSAKDMLPVRALVSSTLESLESDIHSHS